MGRRSLRRRAGGAHLEARQGRRRADRSCDLFARSSIYDEQPAVLLALMDITERKRAEARLAFMAQHDALTGLPNRNLLRQQHGRDAAAYAAQRREGRRADARPRQFQGGQRHARPWRSATSCCAASPSACARRCARRTRWRGSNSDEFAVVQSGMTRPEDAALLARRLLGAIGDPYLLDGHSVVIGATIGIAMAPGDGEDSEKLLKNADMALSRAKDESRGTFSLLRGRRWTPARRAAARSRSICATPSRTTCCGRIISRWSISRPAASPASRRWCAGRIPSAAWSRRPSSFRSPRKPA